MKNMMKKGILLVFVLSMVLAVTACGKPDTFEEYLKGDEEMSKQLDQVANMDENMDCFVKDNTITFKYVFPMEFSEEETTVVKTQLESAIEAQVSVFENVLKQAKEATEIDEINIKLIYADKNNKELYSRVFE